MKRSLGFCVLTLLICSTAAAATSTVVDQVRALGEDFAAAWNKHDVKAMAALWAPDGDLMNPYGRMASGRAEVEKLFQDEHTTVMKNSMYTNLRSSVRSVDADAAVGDWDIEISGAAGSNGMVMPAQKTHVTSVLKRSGGKWWIVSARAFNLTPAPAMPKKK